MRGKQQMRTQKLVRVKHSMRAKQSMKAKQMTRKQRRRAKKIEKKQQHILYHQRKANSTPKNISHKNQKKNQPPSQISHPSTFYNNAQEDAISQFDSEQMRISELQAKLGLAGHKKDTNKYSKIAKNMGFDDDLFSFLDGISQKVHEKPQSDEGNRMGRGKGNVKEGTRIVSHMASIQQQRMENQINEGEQLQKPVNLLQTIIEDPIQQAQIQAKEPVSDQLKHQQVKKLMNSLFNKISDGNLTYSLRQFLRIFENYPKAITIPLFSQLFSKSNLHVQKPPIHILSSNIVLATALHQIYGNRLMAALLQQLSIEFRQISAQEISEAEIAKIGYSKQLQKKKNFFMIVCYLYEFEAISAEYLLSLVHQLVGQNSQINQAVTEFIYLVVQKCGAKMRNNDPSTLKQMLQIFKQFIARAKEQGVFENTKIKFIEVQINEIRFNRKGIFDVDQRMGFLRTFLNKTVPMEAPVADKQIIAMTYLQLLNADTSVAGWDSQAQYQGEEGNTNQQLQSKWVESQEVKQLRQLAKVYHFVTETRMNIFIELMSSRDYIEATQRILELKVKRIQEIAMVLVEVNLRQEDSFNPFYVLVASKIAERIPKFRVSLQFAIWDRLKQLQSYSPRKVSNLAKFMGWLISSQFSNCSLSMTKFFPDLLNLKPCESVFMKVFFKQLFRKVKQTTLLKLAQKLDDEKNKSIRSGIRDFLLEFQEQNTEARIAKPLDLLIRIIRLQEEKQLQTL